MEDITLDNLNGLETCNEGYIENLEARLDLIKFIFLNTDHRQKMTLEILNILWENLIAKALVLEEKNLFFKWVTESSESTKFQIDNRDLLAFYSNNVEILNDEDITLDGYLCF